MTNRTEIVWAEDSGTSPDTSPAQYLTFRIANETYAVGILQVREIVQYEALTAVPSTPRSIRGVMNLRGSVVAVADLAVKFGLPPSAVTKRTCVIILELSLQGELSTIGVIADAVNEVLQLSPDDIRPPPPFGTRVHADYLVGMVQAGQGFTLILDLEHLLTVDELQNPDAAPLLLAAAETDPAAGPTPEPSAPAVSTDESATAETPSDSS
jgi:purine-binding chemotaxis protein CheW